MRDTAPVAAAARFRRRLAGREAGVVGERERLVQSRFVVAAVIDRAERIAVGERAHEVRVPQCRRVHVQFARRPVHQPFDDEAYFRAPGRAVGLGRHGMAEHRPCAHRRRRDVVGAGHQDGALAERRERDAACAHIGDIVRLQGEEAPACIEGQRRAGDQVAALIVAHHRLGPAGGPAHRPSGQPRRPQHDAELNIDAVAHAEIAADIVADDPQPVGIDSEHRRQLALVAHRAARAGI